MYIEQEINSKEFWESYQQQAWNTCTSVSTCSNYDYLSICLLSETGEVAGKIQKYIRGDYTDRGQLALDIRLELGDCLWGLFCLSTLLCWDWNIRLHPTPKIKDEKHLYAEVRYLCLHTGLLLRSADIDLHDKNDLLGRVEIIITSLRDIADYFGWSLKGVARVNTAKLMDRHKQGKIQGSGDYR